MVGARTAERPGAAAAAARGDERQLPTARRQTRQWWPRCVRPVPGWKNAGYAVEEVEPPSLAEVAELWMLIADDEARKFMWPAIEQFGDEGVRRSFGFDAGCLAGAGPRRAPEGLRQARDAGSPLAAVSGTLPRWCCAPCSGEPPFPWGRDVDNEASMARVMRAQETQFAVPVLGLPGCRCPQVSWNLPMGVQLVGRDSARTWCWTPPK